MFYVFLCIQYSKYSLNLNLPFTCDRPSEKITEMQTIYIYIYNFLCLCLCSFPNLIFTSKERPFQWTKFLALHYQNLYARHVSFVRATCFIQNIYFCIIRKTILSSVNHEPSHRANSTRPPLPRPSSLLLLLLLLLTPLEFLLHRSSTYTSNKLEQKYSYTNQ